MGASATRPLWRAVVLSVVSFFAVALNANAIEYTIAPYANRCTDGLCLFMDLNDGGLAVGVNATEHVAYKSDGATITTFGQLAPTSLNTDVKSINNSGIAVGASADRIGNTVFFSAVTFTGTTATKLLPQLSNSFATAINDAGQIVGGLGNPTSSTAFIYDSGLVTNIGRLPGTTRASATAINSSGVVVGLSKNGSQTSTDRGFIWQDDVLTNLGLPSVAGPVASIDFVEGINDDGWVTGSWQNWVNGTPQPRRAFLYRNGVMEDLLPSVFQSDAEDINNLGQIIGDAEITSGVFASFLWDNGTFSRLSDLIDPASGWEIFGVEAINDEGQIIGFGKFNGVSQSFILNPVTIPTPLPTSVWLFGSGLAALLGLRRRRA